MERLTQVKGLRSQAMRHRKYACTSSPWNFTADSIIKIALLTSNASLSLIPHRYYTQTGSSQRRNKMCMYFRREMFREIIAPPTCPITSVMGDVYFCSYFLILNHFAWRLVQNDQNGSTLSSWWKLILYIEIHPILSFQYFYNGWCIFLYILNHCTQRICLKRSERFQSF